MIHICILGSTGSIGTQALSVCERLEHIQVSALAANSNVALLAEQAIKYHPKQICIYDQSKYSDLKKLLTGYDGEILTGMDGLCELSESNESDLVLNAVVGMVGLQPTMSAISAHKTIALANKETLVTGGKLVMEAARENGVSILPVDSEHSAIFQSLQGNPKARVKKLILTASGGPFYGKNKEELNQVSIAQALAHPNWSMGKKISIDSATMMNKGLELIEACWLFDKRPEEVEIVIHRESVVHSMVEYADCAVIAQLGVPDMKIPIQYALTYPDRLPCDTPQLSFTDYPTLSFSQPDEDTFVCLRSCREAMKKGGLYPAIVNGANEQAVSLFLENKIPFLEIGRLVEASLRLEVNFEDTTIENINTADRLAREFVLKNI